MALPINILNVPTFELVVPSTEKKIKCRPFLVKEEKILLMALEANNEQTTITAIKQVLDNCILDKNGQDIDMLALFDLEYIFIKLRSRSKGEKIKIKFKGIEESECEECKKPKEVAIDLGSLEIIKDPKHKNNIKITKDVGIVMRYPQFSLLTKLQTYKETNEFTLMFDLIIDCIESIYDKDSVYQTSEYTKEEITDFVERLTEDQFEKITDFFMTMPKMEHELDLSCKKCGRKDIQKLSGLQSFFQ